MESMLVKHPSSRQSSTKSQRSTKNLSINKINETIVSLARNNSEKQLLKNIIINNKENEILNKIDLEDMCPDFLTSAEAAELVIKTSQANDTPTSYLKSNSSESSPSPSLTLSSSSSPSSSSSSSSSDTDSFKILTNADTRVKSSDKNEQQLFKKNKVQTLIDNEHHSNNPHHHIHRHRHVHHHRNYEGHIHLHANDDDNLNDESVDDPDSMIPSWSHFLNSSSDNGKAPLSHYGASSKCQVGLTNIGINILKADDAPIIEHDEINVENMKTKDNLICYTPNVSMHGSCKNVVSLANSPNVYRSTPNLCILDGDNESVDGSMLDSNQIKNKNNSLIRLKTNYPSNLELSTNLSDLQEQLTPILLNNEIDENLNEKLSQTLKAKFILNTLNKMDVVSKLSNKNILSNSNAIVINNNNSTKKNYHRFKLIVEGDVNVCKLPNSRNYISKILNSKLLRRWKTHRLVLTDTEIFSSTKSDFMDSSIPYHTIIEISPISKWEPGQKYCFRVATIECHYLIQTNNAYVRDQWMHSITWKKHKFKSERVLRNAVRQEVLLKEIRNLIEMSMTTPVEDTEIYSFPLELVSEILQKHEFPKKAHEEIIIGLSPLLEKNHPSPELCDFFSKHCIDSPRSRIVIQMFTPVVQRILKHNGDFGKYPRMRIFVQDYLMALISQNDGLQKVQSFVRIMHSTSSQCPFSRVLPNFVAVCLAAVHSCFEQRKSYRTNVQLLPAVKLSEQERQDKLKCFTTMMYTMSKFDDWRAHLSQLLQSVPFPDQSLTHSTFTTIFRNVVENFAQDPRCEVHQTLLGIREGKEGWFEIFCPGGISCDDDGELFSIMLQNLIGCCCKKKRFLLSINKLLPQIILLASREIPSALETLCAMLDLDGVENSDDKLQIITTLQGTNTGQQMYEKVCERQAQLKELQQKGGPRKLTLPSRSTDDDLAKLLLSGSFGNLECLSLAFTNVTSACAEYLIKLPSLRYLNLWSTKFGDEGLELISEHLQRLQVLNLCETPVTDKGLACLASMKQLRKLNLNSTNLSELTFEGLKECLPALQECDIRYTDAW